VLVLLIEAITGEEVVLDIAETTGAEVDVKKN
jgi:hypothetical protein